MCCDCCCAIPQDFKWAKCHCYVCSPFDRCWGKFIAECWRMDDDRRRIFASKIPWWLVLRMTFSIGLLVRWIYIFALYANVSSPISRVSAHSNALFWIEDRNSSILQPFIDNSTQCSVNFLTYHCSESFGTSLYFVPIMLLFIIILMQLILSNIAHPVRGCGVWSRSYECARINSAIVVTHAQTLGSLMILGFVSVLFLSDGSSLPEWFCGSVNVEDALYTTNGDDIAICLLIQHGVGNKLRHLYQPTPFLMDIAIELRSRIFYSAFWTCVACCAMSMVSTIKFLRKLCCPRKKTKKIRYEVVPLSQTVDLFIPEALIELPTVQMAIEYLLQETGLSHDLLYLIRQYAAEGRTKGLEPLPHSDLLISDNNDSKQPQLLYLS